MVTRKEQLTYNQDLVLITSRQLGQSTTQTSTQQEEVLAGKAPAELMKTISPHNSNQPARQRTVMSGSRQPTNYDMLIWRTLNRELRVQGANQDYLAEKLRDELMPFRSWCMRFLPGANLRMQRQLDRTVPGAVNYIDSRTTWLDGVVKDAIKNGITQVIVVAAGFDTRAYRFHTPGVSFFEIDLPHASIKKQELVKKLNLLPEAAPPTYASADLSVTSLSDVLSQTSFDSSRPALFTIEGLLYYIPFSAVEALFKSIASVAAPGSKVCFDFLDSEVLEGKTGGALFQDVVKIVSSKDEPFVSGLKADAEAMKVFSHSVGLEIQCFLTSQETAAAAFGPTWVDKQGVTVPFMASAVLCKA